MNMNSVGEWALWDVERPVGLQRLVLVVLAMQARPDGIVMLPRRQLRAGCGWPNRWRLRRALAQLELHGEIEARPAVMDGYRITVYRLAWPGRRPIDVSKYRWVVERPFSFDLVDEFCDERPRLELIIGGGEA